METIRFNTQDTGNGAGWNFKLRVALRRCALQSIEAVPEPSAVASVVTGGLAILMGKVGAKRKETHTGNPSVNVHHLNI